MENNPFKDVVPIENGDFPLENSPKWKETILLEGEAFFTEPWLWEEGFYYTSIWEL